MSEILVKLIVFVGAGCLVPISILGKGGVVNYKIFRMSEIKVKLLSGLAVMPIVFKSQFSYIKLRRNLYN